MRRSAILLAGVLVACLPGPAGITVQSLDAARARWEARPVHGYHIIVDVERPGDRRRNEVTVLDDTVIRASVAYWDESRLGWGPARALTAGQATPFSVPGLFDLIRQELLVGHRSECRVAFVGDPPVPGRILLGPVMQSTGPVSSTEARILVISFETRPPASGA